VFGKTPDFVPKKTVSITIDLQLTSGEIKGKRERSANLVGAKNPLCLPELNPSP